MTSVDGLTGGTITSSTTITGDLGVSGDLTVGGRVILAPPSPVMAAGIAIPGCFSTGGGMIPFGVNFSTQPVFVASVDGTLGRPDTFASVQRWPIT